MPKTILTREERKMTISVSDRPDLPNPYGPTVVPTHVLITYWWQHPEHREGWYVPGTTLVEVVGLQRLKSGGVGQKEITRSLSGDHRPEWVSELVAEHMPKGWDR
ncbi:hypothetical protein [Streptomyces sp. NPDC001404]|uniref:hypothetical protein n=1 Tax=Streptomyces sp. NPDC001404 TaxID=3364571 RepID=UPI0036BD55D8